MSSSSLKSFTDLSSFSRSRKLKDLAIGKAAGEQTRPVRRSGFNQFLVYCWAIRLSTDEKRGSTWLIHASSRLVYALNVLFILCRLSGVSPWECYRARDLGHTCFKSVVMQQFTARNFKEATVRDFFRNPFFFITLPSYFKYCSYFQ